MCLKLHPNYIEQLTEDKDETEVGQIDLEDTLRQIANEIYSIDFFNLG